MMGGKPAVTKSNSIFGAVRGVGIERDRVARNGVAVAVLPA